MQSLFSFITLSDANLVVSTSQIGLENTFEPFNSSSMSSSLGMGYLNLIVILLMAQPSTHIGVVPSFFGTNGAGTTYGLNDS